MLKKRSLNAKQTANNKPNETNGDTTAVIIDDDPLFVSELKRILLANFPEIKIVDSVIY